MNDTRRKELKDLADEIASIGEKMTELKERAETLRDEEQEYYDNMPDSIRDGEKGSAVDEVIMKLDEVVDDLDGFDAYEIQRKIEEAAS